MVLYTFVYVQRGMYDIDMSISFTIVEVQCENVLSYEFVILFRQFLEITIFMIFIPLLNLLFIFPTKSITK